MGRTARGVKGITLSDGDYVVGVALVDESKTLLTVTELGMRKRTSFEDFRQMKRRGGKGVTCHKISDKTGKLSTIVTVDEDDDIMLITNEGTIIRTSVSSINVYSRTAAGVIIMRLSDGCFINNVARLDKAEDIEKESREVESEIQSDETNAALKSATDTATDTEESEPVTEGEEET
jgi:DNA gyrase subunit A